MITKPNIHPLRLVALSHRVPGTPAQYPFSITGWQWEEPSTLIRDRYDLEQAVRYDIEAITSEYAQDFSDSMFDDPSCQSEAWDMALGNMMEELPALIADNLELYGNARAELGTHTANYNEGKLLGWWRVLG